MPAPTHTDRVNAFFDVMRKEANDSGYGGWISNSTILGWAYKLEAAAERFDPPPAPAASKVRK